ncbi:TTF1 factor, partial [Turnix velox]|nr:TTF1 factor [Turnix velox]
LGIAVKFGRFSEKENKQIRKNIEDFLDITGIDSAEKLLFTSRYPQERGTISNLKNKHCFCEKLAEGIPRPWRLIYYRARKMFDPNNYKGRDALAFFFFPILALNYGPWSKEETQKLMDAVESVLRKRLEKKEGKPLSSEKPRREILIDRETLHQKLPWTAIEAKVGTRYLRQCKQKWSTILTHKMTKGQQLYRGIKGLQAKINLIKRLHELNAETADEVNWDELSNVIGDVPRGYVQGKFYKLKICVPLWQRRTFSEIVDYLFEKELPVLQGKL